MKLILRIGFLSLMALIAAACATTSLTTPTAQPTSTPAPTQANTNQGYVPSDVSLVANTGRPQFLDSYADW
jgi:protein-disulfide isomerase